MKVEIYHSPRCPDCIRAKPILERVLAQYNLEFEYVNVIENRDRAKEAGILRVPTVVIDGKIALVEHFSETELRKEIESRGAKFIS